MSFSNAFCVSALINFGLNMVVVLVFMLVSGMNLLETSLWFPLLAFEVYVFSLGLSLLLSAIYVKYRDISYIWEVGMQGLFYLTPIIYPLTLIPNVTFQKVILLNPMAQAIQDARFAVVTPATLSFEKAFGNPVFYLIPIGIILVTLFLGVSYFKKESKNFAENI